MADKEQYEISTHHIMTVDDSEPSNKSALSAEDLIKFKAQNEDFRHDIDNKYTLSKISVGIIIALYVFAIVIIILSFCYALAHGIFKTWPVLTFSLLLMTFPFTLHLGFLNKLYGKATGENKGNNDVIFPLVEALSSLIKAVADKLGKS